MISIPLPLVYVFPILILIISSFFGHHVILSLTIANLIGAFSILYLQDSVNIISWILKVKDLYINTLSGDTLKIFTFIVMLSCIVELLIVSGFASAYASYIQYKIHSKRKFEFSLLGTNFLFFLDDYLAAFNLKAFGKPLLKVYGIAKEKFAYMLNAQAASLCLLIPMSSWGLMLWGQYKNLYELCPSEVWNPFGLLFTLIPFLLYPLCSVANVWWTVLLKKSHGSMKKHEEESNHIEQGASVHFIPEVSPLEEYKEFIKLFGIFFITLIFQLSYYIFYNSIQDISLINFMLKSSIFSYLYLQIRLLQLKRLSDAKLILAHKNGILIMYRTIVLLISAWTFAACIKELDIFSFILFPLKTYISHFFYPVFFFVLAFLTECLLGTAWGVIAIIFPMVICLPVLNYIHLYLILASVISGAIAGSHFTPISDAMAICAGSAEISIAIHAKIQREYSMAPLTGTIFGIFMQQILIYFFPCSYSIILWGGLIIALGITLLITYKR
jgi:tetracycline resistance efflux pump